MAGRGSARAAPNPSRRRAALRPRREPRNRSRTRHPRIISTRSSSINSASRSRRSTLCRNRRAAAPESTDGTGTNVPSVVHPSRDAIAWTCGCALAELPKVCGMTTMPGWMPGPLAASVIIARTVANAARERSPLRAHG